MSTHAHYVLWAGFLKEDLNEDISDEFCLLLKELRGSYKGIEREGLLLSSISMHEETIGYGVVLTDLEWSTTEERPASPDLEQLQNLVIITDIVHAIFVKTGLPKGVRCMIYHHIDLGA